MLDGPFRGADALARALVTPAQLRTARFVSPFRGIYLPAGPRPPDLVERSRAAFLLVRDDEGALAGYSAAAILGADCAPRGAPAEIVQFDTGSGRGSGCSYTATPCRPPTSARPGPVERPRRCAPPGTSRRLDLVEAVVAVDALARRGRFVPDALLERRAAQPGARGCRRLDRVVALADPRAESPMESRLRLLLVLGGLPTPAVQYEVLDAHGFVLARADLAYPHVRLAIEYDGESHLRRRTADNRRDTTIAELGWETMRLTSDDVLGAPLQTFHAVDRMVAAREATLVR